jgi:hypothetical protein
MLRSRHLFLLSTLAAALFVLTGCSGGRPAIEGTVTLNNEPVDGGTITLVPVGKDHQNRTPVSIPIVGGKFALLAGKGPKVGEYRVEIVWKKKTGKKVPVPGDPGNEMDETVEAIPPKYNTESMEKVEVKSSGNSFNFPLKP